MDWRVKGLIQKGLSTMPYGVRLNTRLQSMLGGLRNFDVYVADKASNWAACMGYLSGVNFSVSGKRLVEIGTGWHPALPLCFHLAGADSVATFDIVRLLDEKAVFRILDSLEQYIPQIADLAGETPATIAARLLDLRRSKNLDELLGKSRIEYFAPADACATGLSANSIDLIYSNSVLEHVPKNVIAEMMKESFRVLKPGGLAMHNVACNDHYASFDKSISYVNFLQYDERGWRLWNNSLQYQNRLRAPEFLELATEAGFEVIAKKIHVRPGALEALNALKVAPEFARFSRDDVAATTVDFVARKPAV